MKGDLFFDFLHRTVYSTDASAYREVPLGIASPKDVVDIKEIISFAKAKGVSIIPRVAGTFLAGQVVGIDNGAVCTS